MIRISYYELYRSSKYLAEPIVQYTTRGGDLSEMAKEPQTHPAFYRRKSFLSIGRTEASSSRLRASQEHLKLVTHASWLLDNGSYLSTPVGTIRA